MVARGELIIVARSGRALAQSARRGGWRPLVFDAFADLDTQACAQDFVRVGMDAEGLLSKAGLMAHLASLSVNANAGLIYGAGMEAMPELLQQLSERYRIVGNAPEVLRAVTDPITFSAGLRALNIPHPRTRFAAPERALEEDTDNWLVKRAGSAGGVHVRPWDGAHLDALGVYFQRYLPGPPMSALFAADGHEACILGYNTQWIVKQPRQSFAYAGAVNRARLTARQREMVADYVTRLTRAFGLRGVNGLDFVLHGGEPMVLEINPRTTATCELYEPDTRDGMVSVHARASDGELPDHRHMAGTRVRAHAIVYARGARRIPAAMQWPRWCRDLPEHGAAIAAGAPVCSVHAEGDDMDLVSQVVFARREYVLNALNDRSMAA